jgi:hypothetical protein
VVAMAPAPARASLSCARSGATIAANSQSRVFRRGTVTSGETKGAPLYYGCSRRTGHIRRLNRRGDFGINRVTGSTIRLAGRGAGQRPRGLRGRHRRPRAHPARHRGVDRPGLRALHDATAGVRAAGHHRVPGDDLRLHDRHGPVRRARRLPFGGDRSHSLALAANSHAIYWTEAGAARTAPIR